MEKYRKLAEAVCVFNAQLALGRKKINPREDADGTPDKAWEWLKTRDRSEWWFHAAGVQWEPVVDSVGERLGK